MDGGETIQCVLQAPPSVERALPVVSPVAAGLVIDYLEGSRSDFVNSIDAACDAERDAFAQIDLDWFGRCERFAIVIQRAPERHFQSYGR